MGGCPDCFRIVSVLGGGKFANGAITGAFSRLFNDEATVAKWNSRYKKPAFMYDKKLLREFDKAWEVSNPNADSVYKGLSGSLKVEQGGWIFQHKETGNYFMIRAVPGVRDELPAMSGEIPYQDNAYFVGTYHTHPNTVNEGYELGPSPYDENANNNHLMAPMVIRNHEGYDYLPYPPR